MYKLSRQKNAYILVIVALVLLWEFTFPGQAVGHEILETGNIQAEPTITEENIETRPRLPISADKPREEAKQTVYLTITAYSSTPDQTSGDPFITASGSTVRDGIIAANFLPIGTRVRIPEYYGDKIFVVEDRMHQRYWYMADIWMESREEAIEWGARYTTLEVL
ncbi:hypothetical protein ACFL0L_01400 [Patescibacteria group bacterium]